MHGIDVEYGEKKNLESLQSDQMLFLLEMYLQWGAFRANFYLVAAIFGQSLFTIWHF